MIGLGLLLLLLTLGRRLVKNDSPEDFARLCEITLPSLPSQDFAAVELTAAEQALAGLEIHRDLQRIADNGLILADIARETLKNYIQREAVAKDAGTALLAGAVGFLKNVYGEKPATAEAGRNAMWESAKGVGQQAVNGFNLIQDMDVLRLKLAKLAAQFSGPVSSGTSLFIELTEQKPGFWATLGDKVHAEDGVQTLRISHGSEKDLHDCMVSVRMITASGKSFFYHYYIPSWARGDHRRMQYDTGSLLPETDETVTRVQVQVHARELTTLLQEITRAGPSWPYTP